jgi:hypothetical protein
VLTVGSLAFLSPWVLTGLIALPVIWWLLRFTPPQPQRHLFPPFRLLLELRRTEETPDRSPWWLTVLRMTAAAIVIIAFARPVLNPSEFSGGSSGPLAIIVDDGWAAAAGWSTRQALLDNLLQGAALRGRQVMVVATASDAAPAVEAAELAERRAGALAPVPFAPSRLARLAAAGRALGPADDIADVVWIADGLDYGDGAAVGETLGRLAPNAEVTMFVDGAAQAPLWLTPADVEDGVLTVSVTRAEASERRSGEVSAYALNGRLVDRQPFVLGDGETSARVDFGLPSDLRNQVVRVAVSGVSSAGAVTLLDERWQTRIVALVSGGSAELAQPLLAPLYYVERALAPFADLRKPVFGQAQPDIKEMIADGLSMLVLADVGTLIESDREAVTQWVENGGMLVRFAGPRLASGGGELLPVALRQGGRTLGGALSWDRPQSLAKFDDDSPFAGLTAPGEVQVTRQVLAEPDVSLGEKTWARLEDGTPLVTASRLGRGRIVLFHVTANADWSNLPLSVLFVDMLNRLLRLSQSVASSDTAAGDAAFTLLRPNLVLDGMGRLGAPPPTAEPIERAQIDDARPSIANPPGFYGPSSGRFALNTISDDDTFAPLQPPAGADLRQLDGGQERELLHWLLIAAIALMFVDLIAVMAISGQIVLRRTASAVALAVALGAVAGGPARAQDATGFAHDEFALQATLTTRLAYVVTGDEEVDAVSEAGLGGLGLELRNRTALEPGAPLGINLERDEMVFFPLIYWPVLPDAEQPSEAALARIDAYMKNGGTLFFDTRDEINALPSVGGGRDAPGLAALQRILAGLDIPALSPVPANHVLTKAFYLLQSFPGRFDGGPLWVEASAETDGAVAPTDRSNADGVSSILIGSNDYAGAWAIDGGGTPLLPMGSGIERQRELAFRVGINIVMYALTGNYKADQVHIPALLERLGQ